MFWHIEITSLFFMTASYPIESMQHDFYVSPYFAITVKAGMKILIYKFLQTWKNIYFIDLAVFKALSEQQQDQVPAFMKLTFNLRVGSETGK